MTPLTDPTVLSLMPAILAIVLAFLTRRVVPALFLGIVSGGVVMFVHSGDPADLDIITRFFLPALGSETFAQILLIYLWCLGGLIGLWGKTGGALHFARVVGGRIARGPRSSLFFAWLLGVVFHQGGTVSTVLTGTTARPMADTHGVAHEELSYVVDSTSSPVATILPFNAWPAYIGGMAVGTVPILVDEADAVSFFMASIPFNFYAIFAVTSTLLFSMGWLPWVGGKMRAARERARTTGALDAPTARPMMGDVDPESTIAAGYQPSLLDFVLPIGVLISLAIIPYMGWRLNWINQAFGACTLTAIVIALVRGMPLATVLDGFLDGCKSMTIGAIILGLAVTIGLVAKELNTAAYVVSLVGDALPAVALPGLLTGLCMLIAFATGTSWGTYAVVVPVALPLAWALHPDPLFLRICFGAVIGGAVFGDQCSPISDTTILSSMFSGCDLMDHVNTQLPLALAAAGLGAVAGTVVAAIAL